MGQTNLLFSFAGAGERRSRDWTGLWLSASGHGLVIGLAGAIAVLSPLTLPEPAAVSNASKTIPV